MTTRQSDDAPVSSRATRGDAERQSEEGSPDSVTGPIASLIRQIGIDRVYGTPITQGETTVVPVADVRTGFGFGRGQDAGSGGGEGGGGGAGLRLSPRGYLHITPDGVRYRPIYDLSTILLGGAFAGWLLYRLLSRD